ncbi:MAG TPA: flagellar filament capping protein FliD [Bryobacteraceae bacterium]|nr:flagellar filament capping protein FliD [Bryobacteraceae bacterium]
MSNVSGIFAGNSRYATDFQSVVQRSVLIASLPKTLMETQKSSLDSQASALRSIETAFGALQSALSSIGSSTGMSSYSSHVSDGAVAKATISAGAMEGAYSFEVTALGSYTNTMAPDAEGDWLVRVADPAAESLSPSITSFTLRVSGEQDVMVSGNNLNEIAAAINKSGKPVRATAVNVGPPGDPDYRLSVEATKLGPVSISVSAKEADDTVREFLAGIGPAGEPATYLVNGKSVSSTARQVTLATGLTVELLAEGAATATVKRSTGGISSALSVFANAYNAAASEIAKHRGQGGGALTGNGLMGILSRTLARIASHSSSGSFAVFKDLGLELGKDGLMKFDAAAFSNAVEGSFPDLIAFLGTAETGGFLKAATEQLNAVTAETSGLIGAEQQMLDSQITYQEDRIAEEQTRIDALTERLNAQMAAADALIASLEQQAIYISNMFESMRAASETYS